MGSASMLYYGIKLINMMIIIMITMMMMIMMMIIIMIIIIVINNNNNSKKKGTVHQKDFYLILSPGPRNWLIS